MKQHKVVTSHGMRSEKTNLPLTTTDDQKCEDHEDEIKKFYCETCQKPVCRDCIIMKQHCRDHECITLKEAAQKQTTRLVHLAQKGNKLKTTFEEAIQKTDDVKKHFESSFQKSNKEAEEMKIKYIREIVSVFKKYESKALKLKAEREAELDHTKENLKASLAKIESACDLAKNTLQMGTDFDITSMYPTLSTNLEELTKMERPYAVDESQGCFRVQEVGELKVPDVIWLVGGERWTAIGQINTLRNPRGIVIHPNGDTAITTGHFRTAQIHSRNGDQKNISFKGPFDVDIYDIAVTSDGKYILPGKGESLFYDEKGNRMKNTKASTCNPNNNPANPTTLAVDARDRIIVGLSDNTAISIHRADGQLISKFATTAIPWYVAATSKGEIAATFQDHTLQLMDFSGNHVREVKPPSGVSKWEPFAICCSKQGEIFVVNRGYQTAVYRYTADGNKCLGCVTTGLDSPWGIAITENGQQLYATESNQQIVKIFKRS